MDRTHLERAFVRAAPAVGFLLLVGLWLYTADTFRQSIDAARDDATMTERYREAQKELTTVRTLLSVSSSRVRDALLTSNPTTVDQHRHDVEECYRVIRMAIDDYEPVIPSSTERDAIAHLQSEVEQFNDVSMTILATAPAKSATAVRNVVNTKLAPRRDAAVLVSEQMQALNRHAYIRQQAQLAGILEAADLNSRRQLRIALAVSGMCVGLLLVISLYAGKLDKRLSMQLKRDARLSRELYDATTALLAITGRQGEHASPDDPTLPPAA